ncbi:hypothetical protein [Streptococcus sp. KS 6]|uniref:hypothetical protein n=1 Tax=Streptococcus sp. KS 6 TaxID=2598457 RepID=UPI001780C5F0|nr:hypothetical protein [Streptococcus sp. KS 6]
MKRREEKRREEKKREKRREEKRREEVIDALFRHTQKHFQSMRLEVFSNACDI